MNSPKTEKHTADGSLNGDDQPFKTLFMQAPAAIALLEGPEHLYTFANPVYQKLFRRTEAQLMGRTVRQVWPEAEGQGLYELFHSTFQNGEPFVVDEFPITFQENGQPKTDYYNLVIQPMKADGGAVTSLMVQAYEVTRQVLAYRKAAQALAESENHLRKLTDTVPAIIWITEPDGSCSYLNQHWYEFTSQTPEEAEGFGWLEATHPDDKDEAGKIFIEANQAQKPFSLLYRLRTRSGDYHWCKDSGSPRFSKDGVFEGYIGTVVDVHEEKLAEERIRQSEKQFKDITEAIPQLVWVCNAAGEVTYFNSKWYQFTGASPEESLGTGWYNRIHPDDVLATLEKWKEAQQTASVSEAEYRLKTADGSYRWVLAKRTPIKDSQGNLEKWFGTFTDIHERKNTEQALEESEARLKAIVDQTPAPTLVLRGDELRIEQINTPMLQLIGRGEDVKGHPLLAILPELEEQFVWTQVQRVYREGIPFELGEMLVSHNRTGVMEDYYYNVAYHPFKEGDAITGMIQVAIDVTEQVVSRKKLEESESRLRNIVDKSPDPILILKGEDLILDLANEPLFKLWQVGKEALGKPFLDILPEMKEQVFLGLLLDVYRTGVTHYGHETPAYFERASGVRETVYFNFTYQPFRETDGHISGVLVTATDVTQHVMDRKKLEESESRFRNLSDHAPMFIFMADENVHVTYVNKALLHYVNLSHFSEFTGQVWAQHVHPDEVGFINAVFAQAWETRSPYQMEIRLREAATGQYNWFLFTGVPRYEGETFKGFLGTGVNIQQQKELTEDLEQKVRERTAELDTVNKELYRSNEDLQQFAHVASHDLKEPVRKVKTFSSRLRDELKDTITDKGKQYLNKIHSATDRIYTMIEGVLNYSTVNAATQRPQPVDLNEVINSIETDLEVTMQKTGAQIQYESLPTVEGASVLLYQLFYNLINNSIKFAKKDVPPQIHLASERFVNGNQSFVRIVVSDNGIGFEEQQAQLIFDTFTRLNSKDEYEGTGLGLALCKKIVERHGGTIQASGKPDAGATFTIELPVQQIRTSI